MLAAVRIGLTGGIGSGKSTVATLLAQRGAAVVDADAIAHALSAAGGAAMPLIGHTFGPAFITPAGALDRDKMRHLIHGDPQARQQLESIIHPLVALETQVQAEHAAAQGRTCIVFDIPLLVESARWRQRVDHVLVVDCPAAIQICRVMARSQLTHHQVEKIMASQASRARRLAAADTVIFNGEHSLTQLEHEVDQIAQRFGLSSN